MPRGELKKEEEALVVHTYPLCKYSDMPEEMRQEAMEMCVTATEKYADNYEHAARSIKDGLDKRFGGPYHVVVGESYACAVKVDRSDFVGTQRRSDGWKFQSLDVILLPFDGRKSFVTFDNDEGIENGGDNQVIIIGSSKIFLNVPSTISTCLRNADFFASHLISDVVTHLTCYNKFSLDQLLKYLRSVSCS